MERSTCFYIFKLIQSSLYILLSQKRIVLLCPNSFDFGSLFFCPFFVLNWKYTLGYFTQVSEVMFQFAKKIVSLHKDKFIAVSKSTLEAVHETNSEKAVNEHR